MSAALTRRTVLRGMLGGAAVGLGLPALEVSRKLVLSFPPSLPFTFVCCPRLQPECEKWCEAFSSCICL